MKPRQLILHAGPHKTGTSAIQAVLRSQTFSEFYYPRTGQWPDGSHHNLVFNLVPELMRADAEPLTQAQLLDQLLAELADVKHEKILISSEFLSTGCAQTVVNWLVKHGLVDPEGLRALLVERDPLSRAASLYNQAVKDPYVGEVRSPDQWLTEESAKLDLEPMLTDLRAAGAAVTVVAYEPAQDLVVRFLMAAGAQEEELPDQIPWTNTSISEPVLNALLEVNRTVTDVETRLKCREQIFKELRPTFMPSSATIFGSAQ